MWPFDVADVEHTLQGQFVEEETVAHIVVGTYGLRVVVDHHSLESHLLNFLQGSNSTPVKLDRRADAVSTRTEHDDRRTFATRTASCHIIGGTVVGHVEIVGVSRIFARSGVDLLYDGNDAEWFTQLTNQQTLLMGLYGVVGHHEFTDLIVGESHLLSLQQQSCPTQTGQRNSSKLLLHPKDILESEEEPTINLGDVVQLIDRISLFECESNSCQTLVGRVPQFGFHIGYVYRVRHKSMQTLTYHSHTFLNGLLERTTDSHHFTHRFHRRANQFRHTVELTEVPTRNLTYHIIECRFEEGRSTSSHRVLNLIEPITQSQLSSNKGKWITCSLRCKRRRTAQTCIHLNDPVVVAIGIERILHITFAYNAHTAHNSNGQFTQFVVFMVAQCLRRSHHDTLAGMDA